MGKVTALAEVEAHEGVTRLEDCHLNGHIGLCSGMRLDIGPLCAVDSLEPVDGDLLYLVDNLASAIVAFARITFRILVGADGTHCVENLFGYVIFGCDKLQTGSLAVFFFLDEIKNDTVLFHNGTLITKLFDCIYKDMYFFSNFVDMKDRKLLNAELDRVDVRGYRELPPSGVVVVLDNVRSAHNVGSAFRSSDAFKVDKVYLCGITAVPPSAEIHKSALGAEDSVPWEHCDDTLEAVRRLRADGYTVLSVEQTENSVKLQEFQPAAGGRYALVFGNEVDGVQQEVVDESDAALEIPQFGTKHSLNVSVSVGIVLWQVTKCQWHRG